MRGSGDEFNSQGKAVLGKKTRCACAPGGVGYSYSSLLEERQKCGCESGGHGYV